MAFQRITSNRLPPKSEGSPPDTTEPNGTCPRCNRLANFTVVGRTPLSFDSSVSVDFNGNQERGYDQQLTVLACQGCGQNVVVIEDQFVGGVAKRSGGNSGSVQWRGFHWWLTPGGAASDPSIPGPVADAIKEGERCLAVSAPRAAAVMFRSALAMVVKNKGSSSAQAKTNLAGQLKQMSLDGDLDRTLADWADHVRIVGNSGAHPGELAPVTIDEAQELSRLMTALTDYLYVMPARVARARTKP